ncbi:ribonuclease III [Westerdykella ornata]|uniref:Ribonuclease III n=1 Tax=Westerdykella ornata TaxID=318751 RepID=A0A6A6JR19_WESOR|nr:ribonuclease III [Westerdykella ornata]KAF2278992.1 ribonuclease III [Westerdykella ornata]
MAAHPVESILHYRFSNHDLLDEALLAAGTTVSRRDIQGNPQGNKRLALLGDSIIKEVILEHWYLSGETTEEGTNEVINLAKNTKLSQVAHESGLVEYVIKNPCQQGQVGQRTAASTVEALVGAVYLDCGEDISTVENVLEAINVLKS